MPSPINRLRAIRYEDVEVRTALDDYRALSFPITGERAAETFALADQLGVRLNGRVLPVLLVVSGEEDRLAEVENLIRQVDVKPAQVLVEATILVADVSDTSQLGVDLSFFGGVRVEETSATRIVASTST